VVVEILYAVFVPLLSFVAVAALVAFAGDRLGLHGDGWSATGLVLIACGGTRTLAWTGAILWRARRDGL
jgi:hypothetical protein